MGPSPEARQAKRGQSTILDRFGARPTRLAWPLGWKSLGRDRRTDGRSRWRGNQTHAPPGRTKNGETSCEGYQPLCREVQVTASVNRTQEVGSSPPFGQVAVNNRGRCACKCERTTSHRRHG